MSKEEDLKTAILALSMALASLSRMGTAMEGLAAAVVRFNDVVGDAAGPPRDEWPEVVLEDILDAEYLEP